MFCASQKTCERLCVTHGSLLPLLGFCMLPVSPWNSEGYMRSTRVLVVMLLVCVSVVVVVVVVVVVARPGPKRGGRHVPY